MRNIVLVNKFIILDQRYEFFCVKKRNNLLSSFLPRAFKEDKTCIKYFIFVFS